MPGPNDVLIARRAYEIWEEEGRPHGRDRDHWLKAVEEFSTTIVADPVVLKPIKAPAARPVTAFDLFMHLHEPRAVFPRSQSPCGCIPRERDLRHAPTREVRPRSRAAIHVRFATTSPFSDRHRHPIFRPWRRNPNLPKSL